MKARIMKPNSDLVTVKDVRSLQKLLDEPLRLWHQGKVLLQLDGLTASETKMWERKINSHYSACGCTSSALLTGIALESYVLFLAVGAEDLSKFSWDHIVIGGLIGLLGIFVGKIVGLGWARYRLKKAVRELTIYMFQSGA